MSEIIDIGLIGFGTVGTGVVKILTRNRDLFRKRLGAELRIKAIVDKDTKTSREVKVGEGILTSDVHRVLKDPEIKIVIELIGGVNPAREYILTALREGKHVVTANKALLAEHGEEIFREAERQEGDIYFEGSVGSGIPVVKILRESLISNEILSIMGIINGTSNYILTKMSEEGMSFADALNRAQEKGYAEANPSLDVDGLDSAHKLVILTLLAFGRGVSLKDVLMEGISDITPQDIQYAGEFGYSVKPLSIAKRKGDKLELRVHPALISHGHLLASVGGIYNAIQIRGNAVGEIILYGQGAGQLPAASAVVGDIVEVARNLLYQSPHRLGSIFSSPTPLSILPRGEFSSQYYLRFSVCDRPGVLGAIAGILGKYKVSIASVIQKERKEGDAVPVIMMTHEAKEENVLRALGEIDSLPMVKDKTLLLRVER